MASEAGSSAEGDGREGPGRRGEFAAVAACVGVGLLLSALPTLLWWPEVGRPFWMRTQDHLEYLSMASWAYHDHPTRLADPILDVGQTYPSLQFLPAILAARALRLGPQGIFLAWTLWAGLSLPLAWYLIVRKYFRRPWVAACLVTMYTLSDIGLFHTFYEVFHYQQDPEITRHPTYAVFSGPSRFLKEAVTLSRLVRGKFVGESVTNDQFRVITPGLSLGFLLLYLWLLARARESSTRLRLAGAGLGFGLLFYAYFYFWTAAGLGLLLAMALDAGHRRTYFHVGWIGGLAGLPVVVSSLLFKRSVPPDAYHRADLFVPIPRLGELLIPEVPIALAIIGLVWVLTRGRDLIYLWALAAAALLLLNHQVVTGLQIQNDHWRRAFDPALALLLVLIVGRWILDRRTLHRAIACGLLAVTGLYLTTGVWCRAREARLLPSAMTDYQKYEAQRIGRPAIALDPRSTVAGETGFGYFASILEDQRPLFNYVVAQCPSVTDEELGERAALDAYLSGVDRARFESEQPQNRFEYIGNFRGRWARDPALQAEMIARRVAAYDRIAADPREALARFAVRYVALPAGQSPPAILETTGWKLLEPGPYWQVWEYDRPSR